LKSDDTWPVCKVKSTCHLSRYAPHLIGGADVAEELDAKWTIRQGAEVAAAI